MTAPGHTPGPWVWDGCSLSDFGREFPCSMSMEWIPNGRGAASEDDGVNANVEEDGRLIAAAPDLLEVCIRATEEAKLGKGVRADTLNAMLAAIAKARGGTA